MCSSDLLEGQLARLAELERENQRLAALLGFREQVAATAYGARVIARDPGPLSTTLTIDRGARDGVTRGMAVLAPDGVVGRVVEVSHTVARVALVTDHNSGIDALFAGRRIVAVVGAATLLFGRRLFWLFVGLGNALWLAALLGLLRALGD